jgi:hypothetical protein
MKKIAKTLVLFSLCAPAACGGTPQDELAEDVEALVPAQIEDIGEFMPNTQRTVAYSGHRRYVGIRIRADKGVKILDALDIATFGVKPVAAIADEQLRVLAREIGGPISGAPGHSFSRSEVVAPADGSYWLLWGEDTRQPFSLGISYTVKRSAGVSCHHDNMCISESCVDERCSQTRTGTHVGACIVAADCTSNSCVTGLCQRILLGGACSRSSDCEHNLCENGVCSCLPGGTASSDVQKCCSHHVILGTCAG